MSAPSIARPIASQVTEAETIDFNLTRDDLEAIAHLAFEIARQQQLRDPTRQLLDNRWGRDYMARTSQERAALCAHVIRVMQALVVLGWIQRPG